MSVFQTVIRSVSGGICFLLGFTVNPIVNQYIVPQLTPSIMMSDGPEQVFGVDFIHAAGNVGAFVFITLGVILIYPLAQRVFVKTTNEETDVHEDS